MRLLSEHEQQPKSTNRLRQRLVGGLVVLALGVLLLPLWLDGGGLKTPAVQPVPQAPDITQPKQITIPTPPPAQQTLLNNPPASPVPEHEPRTVDAPAPADAVQPAPAPTAEKDSAPQNPAKPSSDTANRTPTTQTESTANAPPEAQPTPPAPTAENPAAAHSEPKTTDSGSSWVVQLGSFSDELNAKGLARSVSDAGFKVEITPLFAKKGTVWRVRVGPYPTRERAVQATTQLREKLGRDGLVMPK